MNKFNFEVPRSKFSDDGKRIRPCGGHKNAHRRIIRTAVEDGVEFSYHATKGWRRIRVSAPA